MILVNSPSISSEIHEVLLHKLYIVRKKNEFLLDLTPSCVWLSLDTGGWVASSILPLNCQSQLWVAGSVLQQGLQRDPAHVPWRAYAILSILCMGHGVHVLHCVYAMVCMYNGVHVLWCACRVVGCLSGVILSSTVGFEDQIQVVQFAR